MIPKGCHVPYSACAAQPSKVMHITLKRRSLKGHLVSSLQDLVFGIPLLVLGSWSLASCFGFRVSGLEF